MTEQNRREITGLLLKAKENSETTDNYETSIYNIQKKVSEDRINREEFLWLNQKLLSFKTELENSSGLFLDEDFIFPVVTLQYYTDANNTIEENDAEELWNGAKLTENNLFYVPVVSNSEKLILDVVNLYDTDGTSNTEPIIPENIKTYSSTHIEQFNEKTTMDLIDWAKAAYSSGYSPSSSSFFVEPEDFSNKLYYYTDTVNVDPGYFTVGNYLYFKNDGNYFVGIIENKGSEVEGSNFNFFIEIMLLTDNFKTSTIEYTEKIVALSDNAKDLLIHIVNYWKSLIISQYITLEDILEPSTEDLEQISLLQDVETHIDDWLSLSYTDKFLTSNLNSLTSIFSQRVLDIDDRKTFIENSIQSILDDRSEIIKLRLRKRGGTLNSVYRETLSLITGDDTQTTDFKSYNYFKNKFVVKRILETPTNSKILYIKENEGIDVDDIVYITSDSSSLKDIKVIVKDITEFQKEKNDELSLDTQYETVKKVIVSNNVPDTFTYDDNVRMVKQLFS